MLLGKSQAELHDRLSVYTCSLIFLFLRLQSCVYHKNGVPALVLTDKGGLLKAEDGSLLKKWEWPLDGYKLKENVLFHLNKEMYVRVLNKNNVMLHFNSNREAIKIPVGAIPGLEPSALLESAVSIYFSSFVSIV